MADKPEEPQGLPNKIDDYLLINVIATGKVAQVWEVMHEQSGQAFAMKLLLPEAMKEADARNELKHEAKIAEMMSHPNLIRFHGLVMRKTECYIVMELFKTPNLKSWMVNDLAGLQSRFARLFESVCPALGHMHDKGWVHKDIKPENILLNRMSEVRVIDFSLAVKKATAISALLTSKKAPIQGTRTYLAPETIRKEASTPATDIYSLGVTFFECLTGQPPFTGATPQDLLHKHIAALPPLPSLVNPKVTPEMDALILKMLAKKPKDRHQSCDELLADFRKLKPFKEPTEEETQAAEKKKEASAGVSAVEEELLRLMEDRRNSRADAEVSALLARHPELQQKYLDNKARIQKREEEKKAEQERRMAALKKEQAAKGGKIQDEKPQKVAKPPTVAPAPSAYPQPGMPPYGQPMPGYPMPVAGMPYGMPQPGMPPGYPQQGMPMPGTAWPGMPYPGGQYPASGQYPAPGQYPQQQYGMPGATPQMPMPGYPPQPGQYPYPGQMPMPPQQLPPGAAAPPSSVTPPQPVRPATPAPKPTAPPKADDLPLMTELPDIE